MKPHVLLVSFPAQGHINPTLQFAKVLSHYGVRATFVTTTKSYKRICETTGDTTSGVSFAAISDGTETTQAVVGDAAYPIQLQRHGSASLAALIRSFADSGNPVAYVVYNFLIPWVADVAADLRVPSALLWIQPSMVFSIYFHYIVKSSHLLADLSGEIKLPGLPSLVADDLPSFLLPNNPYTLTIPIFADMFNKVIEQKSKWVLVNSFDELEQSVVSSMKDFNINLIGVGPLIPSAFLDKSKHSEDTAFGGDILEIDSDNKRGSGDTNIKDWLDSKPPNSVLYVSFGTLAVLASAQIDEIATGLAESGHYFIWVVRPPENYGGFPGGFEEVVKERGLVVKWCPQVKVLAHTSVGCFVTHSGWNSTLEGLANGKPMICVPQWSDQPTNATFVQKVWRMGIRATKREDGVIEREELKRCIRVVMEEERGKEMRENALTLRDLAREATGEGCSSDRNIRAFIDDVKSWRYKEEQDVVVNKLEQL